MDDTPMTPEALAAMTVAELVEQNQRALNMAEAIKAELDKEVQRKAAIMDLVGATLCKTRPIIEGGSPRELADALMDMMVQLTACLAPDWKPS